MAHPGALQGARREEARVLYQQGLSTRAVAERLAVTKGAVETACRDLLRRRGPQPQPQPRRPKTPNEARTGRTPTAPRTDGFAASARPPRRPRPWEVPEEDIGADLERLRARTRLANARRKDGGAPPPNFSVAPARVLISDKVEPPTPAHPVHAQRELYGEGPAAPRWTRPKAPPPKEARA